MFGLESNLRLFRYYKSIREKKSKKWRKKLERINHFSLNDSLNDYETQIYTTNAQIIVERNKKTTLILINYIVLRSVCF